MNRITKSFSEMSSEELQTYKEFCEFQMGAFADMDSNSNLFDQYSSMYEEISKEEQRRAS